LFLLLENYEPGHNLRRSIDRGATFVNLPTPSDMIATAIRGSTSTPGRVVASTQDAARGFHVLVSSDLGDTWVEHPLTLEGGGFPRIFAVTSQALFVKRTALDQTDLWRSTDDGATWTRVLATGAQPPFLSELSNGTLWTAAGAGKTWTSTDGGATWAPRTDLGDLQCVREDGADLYACVLDVPGNTGLLKSTDHGATFSPWFTYDQVVGMTECPATSTIGAVCGDYWLSVQVAMKVSSGPPASAPPKGWCTTAPAPGLAAIIGLVLALRRRRR
jgi:uncharacterized protein (TIGR03382 family)